jgi:trimethylamine--corrinoid protein Co-methyltransferase
MPRKIIKLLSDEELKKIHFASLSILENVGMIFEHKRALEILAGAGANVDSKTKIVKFPPELVEKCLKLVPDTVVYGGRNPENDMVLKADGDLYVRSNAGGTLYVDLNTGKYRRATTDDLKEWCVLIDAMSNVNGLGPLHVEDVPPRTGDLHGALILFEYQRKNFLNQAFSAKNLKYLIEMALAIRGSREELTKRPLFHPCVGIISPLYLNEDDLEMLFIACEYGLPPGMPTMPNPGFTSPITLAGTLAQSNAEMLGGITLTQLVKPGMPMTYYLEPMATDMLTGAGMIAGPENQLMHAALCQMGSQFYRMPVECTGFGTDGIIPEQTMYQKAANGLMACLSGATLTFGIGVVDTFMGLSPTQLIIDNDIAGMVRRICRGFEVNDDTLGVDAVTRIGPKGNFMMDVHTFKYLRSEHYRPYIFDRNPVSAWLDKGGKNLEQQAREKALTVLAEHKVEPLDARILKELRSIVKKADQELVQ